MANRFIATCEYCRLEVPVGKGRRMTACWVHEHCATRFIDPWRMVEVTAKIAKVGLKAYALDNGKKYEDGRPKWTWLPKRMVRVDCKTSQLTDGEIKKFFMPAWLVRSSGVIDHLQAGA